MGYYHVTPESRIFRICGNHDDHHNHDDHDDHEDNLNHDDIVDHDDSGNHDDHYDQDDHLAQGDHLDYDDHLDHDDHIYPDDHCICKEVGGCTQGSRRLPDQMCIAASIALNDESSVTQSVIYAGIELLGLGQL